MVCDFWQLFLPYLMFDIRRKIPSERKTYPLFFFVFLL